MTRKLLARFSPPGPVSRRRAIQLGSALGISLPRLLRSLSYASSQNRPRQAKSVVVLFLSGGPSQLDMWDMKPDAPEEIRGTFQPISSSVPGIQICQHMPRMAKIADKYTIIRSMHHDEGDHLRASYLSMTGGKLARNIVQGSGMQRGDRPHVGAVLAQAANFATEVPSFVMIPEFISPVGVPRPGQHAGFLGARYDPYLIHSDPNLPDYSPGALSLASDTPVDRIAARRELLDCLDDSTPASAKEGEEESYLEYGRRAMDMVSSAAAQKAFFLEDEPAAVRDRYGRHVFGQSTLVARRLIEAGVQLVQVNFVRHDKGKGGQGYDSHSVPPYPPHLTWARDELLPPTDQAFASLVEDLDARGLLDQTIVIMLGEFGRTPRFNKYGGRDHWPSCYSAVVAGGGFRRGHVHGMSDKITAIPTQDPVTPADVLATALSQLGVDPAEMVFDLQDRPLPLCEGRPVKALIAT